ncbi:MAG: SDR family oxidoreductase [Gammaproteobacteria bacterium]|jgi:nucleoside-diphosphate-sugar epimerase|nr:SDR family oxidoreductase [Gammaproteobacteria bacterium]
MKILITGNTGYIGPVVSRHLQQALPGVQITGYDNGYFAHCLTGAPVLPETSLVAQYWGDVREIPGELLDGMDAVIHLAAVSNDPMGKRFEAVTEEINYGSSHAIARQALEHGVKRFVFASSCSMYGYAEGGPRRENDQLNPLTAYARSKVATEEALAEMAGSGMVTTALRFSTACGWSDRIRLDLVLNDFVACAIASKEITVLSDGSPWRPLIDVKDMARSMEWALTRDPAEGGEHLAINVGCKEWNYQVRDLAEAVAAAVPGTSVSINTDAPPDKRSYRVDFSLYASMAPQHQPQVRLEQAIDEIKQGLEGMGFSDTNFRASQFMRLKVIEKHIAEQRLSEALRWL